MEASWRNRCAAGGVNLSLPVRDTLPVRWIQLTPLEDRLQTRRLNPAGFLRSDRAEVPSAEGDPRGSAVIDL